MKYKLIWYGAHLSKSQSNAEIFQNMKDRYMVNRFKEKGYIQYLTEMNYVFLSKRYDLLIFAKE